jgi:acyl carrier protein
MTTERLLTQIAVVLETDASQISEGSTLETLATWDSQREVELAFMLEREYGIELSDEEVNRLHSVAEIRAILAAHGVSISER